MNTTSMGKVIMIYRFAPLVFALSSMAAGADAQEASAPPSTTAAPAATPPAADGTLAVGMAVVDAQGGAVGTITALTADGVTIKTDKHLAAIPRTGLTVSNGKALIGLTQAQLNAQIDQAPKVELKVGGAVKGAGGTNVGTIDAVAADSVTIKLTNGSLIAIPRGGIAAEADGSGKIGLTTAQLDELIKSQATAQ